MSDPTPEFNEPPMTQEEMHAAMFAQMVMQFASTALVSPLSTPLTFPIAVVVTSISAPFLSSAATLSV